MQINLWNKKIVENISVDEQMLLCCTIYYIVNESVVEIVFNKSFLGVNFRRENIREHFSSVLIKRKFDIINKDKTVVVGCKILLESLIICKSFQININKRYKRFNLWFNSTLNMEGTVSSKKSSTRRKC